MKDGPEFLLPRRGDAYHSVLEDVYSVYSKIEITMDELGQQLEAEHARLDQRVSSVLGPTQRLTCLVVGNLARRATTITSSDLEEREAIALLGLCLTPCHWSILRLLLAHPLLSDEELAGLLCLERKSALSSLYELRALGCLEPISTSAGRRWCLRERGLRLLASANHLSLPNMAMWPEDGTTSTLVQR